ncbi:MAG: tRNA (N6-isopentenyl adenosine(37)-C2)-methylthiotransferase MiaB [bacterium]
MPDAHGRASFFIHTYGCQMNVRDSESAAALLQRHGFTPAADALAADVFLVNSCSVRGKAEDKSLGKLQLIISRRQQAGRGGVAGIFGCMAQRLGAALPQRVRGLDVVIGTHRLSSLPGALRAALAGAGPVVNVEEDHDGLEALSGHLPGSVSAYVNILFGCDRGCAYCIVPRVRGHEHSRTIADVLDEVRALAAGGVREVTLLGQSVMAYGRANPVLPDGWASPRGFKEPLACLLEVVDAVPGLARVRFTSGHPSGCTPELVRAMAELPRVCEHLHLPLQSGSDTLLAAMGRGYTSDGYLDAVRRLRTALPGMAITSDVIVGFPGETVADFEATRALMDAAEFDNSYIFQYSPREGTRAAAMPDNVPPEEKQRRNRILLDDQNRRGLALHAPYLGRALEVLAAGVSNGNSGRWTGRTRMNQIVIFPPAPGICAGDLVNVRIENALEQTLYGAVTAQKDES